MGKLMRCLDGRGEGLSYRIPTNSCRVRSRASREQKDEFMCDDADQHAGEHVAR